MAHLATARNGGSLHINRSQRVTNQVTMRRKKKKKTQLPVGLLKFAGLLSAEGIRAWMRTLDYRVAFYDRSVDPVIRSSQRRIYIFWHENILIPLYLRGHCDLAMLLSQHGDAEILAR